MSFAVSMDDGAVEWCSESVQTLRGAVYVKMIKDMLRFNASAAELLKASQAPLCPPSTSPCLSNAPLDPCVRACMQQTGRARGPPARVERGEVLGAGQVRPRVRQLLHRAHVRRPLVLLRGR